MNKEFVIKAVVDAVNKHGAPIILNSDQGSQFTSPDYIDTLKGYGIKVSMDGKGRALITQLRKGFGEPSSGRISTLCNTKRLGLFVKESLPISGTTTMNVDISPWMGTRRPRFITQSPPGSKSGLRNLTRLASTLMLMDRPPPSPGLPLSLKSLKIVSWHWGPLYRVGFQ